MLPLHHNPIVGWAYLFTLQDARHLVAPCSSLGISSFVIYSVVALGIELSATRLSAGFGQPALDYHLGRALRSRTETLLLPKQACFHLHLRPNCQSERSDLNRRSLGPQTKPDTKLRYVLFSVPREGIEPSSAD